MKKLLTILLFGYCCLSLFSCSSNFNTENWEGAVFVSSIDYNGNDFENDSARIELLADSICVIENLSFVEFHNSIKWPKQFTGKWYLYEYEDTKSLIISYDHRQISFAVMPFEIDGHFKPVYSSLRYYVGDPDDMVYHCLIPEKTMDSDN